MSALEDYVEVDMHASFILKLLSICNESRKEQ
jgi:hypothetical protein